MTGCHDLIYSIHGTLSCILVLCLREISMVMAEDGDGGVLNYCFSVMIHEGRHRQ